MCGVGPWQPAPIRPEWAGRAGFRATAHRLAVDFLSVHSLGKCETVKLVTAAVSLSKELFLYAGIMKWFSLDELKVFVDRTMALFIRLIIRLFQLVFSAVIVFFSHNKSANSVFQPAYQHSRTAPMPFRGSSGGFASALPSPSSRSTYFSIVKPIVIDSVPVPVIPAGITRTATQTGTSEAASRTGQNSGRYRLSRANPANSGGIGSLGYSGTVDAEEELTKSLGTLMRRRN
jgi:hypothetical protein